MDHQQLVRLIPRTVESWNSQQITTWLNFIHLGKFIPNFIHLNGSQLMKVKSKKLQQLGVNSNIIQKKLLNWIENGLTSFNNYLVTESSQKQNTVPNFERIKTTREAKKKIHQSLVDSMKQQSYQMDKKIVSKMRITNFEGSQNVFYLIGSNGVKIGRNVTNDIKSLEITVENEHSQIICENNQFFIIDLGTKSGTFIKVHYKLELTLGMLIEMGSYIFKVENFNPENRLVHLKSVNLSNQLIYEDIYIDLNKKSTFSFGRKSTNDFCRDDQHMSGTHAKIFFFNGKFIVEDMGSTNGTWLRISDIKEKSIPYLLQDGTIFKVGNTITYICKYEDHEKRASEMQIEDNSHICTSCNENQRNILFLPCKHTVTCDKCAQAALFCPMCSYEIQEKIKIYI